MTETSLLGWLAAGLVVFAITGPRVVGGRDRAEHDLHAALPETRIRLIDHERSSLRARSGESTAPA